ncbi:MULTISPECIES: MoaD/ThiS family protein [Rhizobium]|uniref:MoaD/ThiS family protein n=1 Tax=Rhizobium TaxID=379 RepID=UPI0017DF979F|nr:MULTISPECIES: MoaD/ThiS family protein [Rhizobium]WSG78289.1 MoaD/ThiS family protein [Rhizobium beringeri]MBA9036753.1 sulfur carrier protein ThiS [Rhizobium leguminosarum]WSG92261.1 MoaD/ThiS family protein [Rhizobium beringeri]WSH18484.1 MoaD/ThiS family protein [Rhizobium beringeri]WSH29490.1 MoaD/ThiS family protein [Rhizobium beringeri]
MHELPIAMQGTARARYRPAATTHAFPVDVTLFAVGPHEVAHALATWGQPDGRNLVFCAHPEPQEGAVMVFPQISAEICPMRGLGIVTSGAVEICNESQPHVPDLLLELGFGPVNIVKRAHFAGRALQTAAAYVVLLALSRGEITRDQVSQALLIDIMRLLIEAMSAPEIAAQLPDGCSRAFAELALHIRAPTSPENDVLSQNLEALMAPPQRKLHGHLALYHAPWRRHGSAFEGLAARLINLATSGRSSNELSSRPMCKKGSSMQEVIVIVPLSIRPYVDGQSRVTVEAQTVRGALRAMSAKFAQLNEHLFDSKDEINRFIRIFVNGRPVPLGSRGDESLESGAEVTLVLALAGG